MKSKFRPVVLGLAAIMLIGCGKTETGEYYAKIDGYIKDNYNALLAYMPSTLNSAISMSAEDGEHIANFVDGLVENDQFGRVVHALAEKIWKNSTEDKFVFTIRENVKWMRNDGTQWTQYVALINGEDVPQYVTAEDFVSAAKYVLDYANNAEAYYLPAMFYKGGWEYFVYTALVNTGRTPSQLVKGIKDYALLWGGIVIDDLTVDDLPNVANFSRVGIHASIENGRSVLTCELQNPAPYFLTALTYTPFLPINEHFINEIGGIAQYGEGIENMLFCGSFLLDKMDQSGMTYIQNPEYWDTDVYRLKTITYKVLPTDIGSDYVRNQYEKGEIDSFGISSRDTAGWKKYVLGPKGTGTIEDPYHDEAYSRYIEVVDSSFIFELNVERSTYDSKKSELTATDITNDNKALKINSVRELFLKGIDLEIYNIRYGVDKMIQEQYQIHTYVPRGFAINQDNMKDYAEYYYEAYARRYDAARYNGTAEEKAAAIAEARAKFAPSQIAGGNHTKAEIKALAEKARADIGLVNGANNVDAKLQNLKGITFPVKIEYLGLAFDAEARTDDARWIETFNQDVNGCTANLANVSAAMPLCQGRKYPYFEIVNNTKPTSGSAYQTMGEDGAYHLYISGWGPDYGDPLTYLNTFTTGGDMSQYTGTTEPVTEAYIESGVVKSRMLMAKYDDLINAGRHQYTNQDSRFTYFAEGEVELLTNVNIIRPLYQMGQGYAISVSKVISYDKPTAAYGLSSYKLKNVRVATKALKSALRKVLKAEYDAEKAIAMATPVDIYNDRTNR